jgi:hypothetical protein
MPSLEEAIAKGAVMLANARTGSNNLIALLNSHPDFHFHGEIFSPKQIMSFKGLKNVEHSLGKDLMKLRAEYPQRFIHLAFTYPPGDYRVRGFKLFNDHSKKALKFAVEQTAIKLIVLRRANLLASFSSTMIGRKTGEWKSTAAAGKSETDKVEFRRHEFDHYREGLEHRNGRIDKLLEGRPNVMRIEYLETGQPEIHARLIDFLGGRPEIALTTKLEKQNASRVVDRFSNPNAVLKYLARRSKSGWAEQG